MLSSFSILVESIRMSNGLLALRNFALVESILVMNFVGRPSNEANSKSKSALDIPFFEPRLNTPTGRFFITSTRTEQIVEIANGEKSTSSKT